MNTEQTRKLTEEELQAIERQTDAILEQFQRGQKTDNGIVAQHISDMRGLIRRQRTADEQTVERVARALYKDRDPRIVWTNDLDSAMLVIYRGYARAALKELGYTIEDGE